MAKDLTDAQVAEYLELKAKAERAKELSKLYWKRQSAKQKILMQKAAEAGIEVTDEEVDAALAGK